MFFSILFSGSFSNFFSLVSVIVLALKISLLSALARFRPEMRKNRNSRILDADWTMMGLNEKTTRPMYVDLPHTLKHGLIHGPIEKRVPLVEEKIRFFHSKASSLFLHKGKYEINLKYN